MLKEKSFFIAILLILICWIGNYLFFQSKQLDKPIFLKHYYESEVYENDLDGNQLTFYYLTNKNDESNVQYVRVDGMEFYPAEGLEMWGENGPNYIEEFRHHYLRTVIINFSKESIPLNQASYWSFKDMEVVFDNQPPMTVNIGDVIFTPAINEEPVLESVVASSNSEHRHDHGLVAKKSVTIDKVTVPFLNLADEMELKIKTYNRKLPKSSTISEMESQIHGTWEDIDAVPMNSELFPMHLKKGDRLQLMSLIKQKQKSFLHFNLHIQGKTDDGKSFSTKVGIIDRPYLTQKDIDKMIASHGGEYR